jgi:hypothetical protein
MVFLRCGTKEKAVRIFLLQEDGADESSGCVPNATNRHWIGQDCQIRRESGTNSHSPRHRAIRGCSSPRDSKVGRGQNLILAKNNTIDC